MKFSRVIMLTLIVLFYSNGARADTVTTLDANILSPFADGGIVGSFLHGANSGTAKHGQQMSGSKIAILDKETAPSPFEMLFNDKDMDGNVSAGDTLGLNEDVVIILRHFTGSFSNPSTNGAPIGTLTFKKEDSLFTVGPASLGGGLVIGGDLNYHLKFTDNDVDGPYSIGDESNGTFKFQPFAMHGSANSIDVKDLIVGDDGSNPVPSETNNRVMELILWGSNNIDSEIFATAEAGNIFKTGIDLKITAKFGANQMIPSPVAAPAGLICFGFLALKRRVKSHA